MIESAPLSGFGERLLDHIRKAAGCPALFESLALGLFRLQWETNAALRIWCKSRGASRAELVDTWREIPAIPTTAFKELEVTSILPADRTIHFCSSGTTGESTSRHWHHAESLKVYEESVVGWFGRHLLPGLDAKACQGMGVLCLTPSPARACQSSLAHMLNTIIKHWRLAGPGFAGWVDAEGQWRLVMEDLHQALRLAQNEGRPMLIMGTAFHYVNLIEDCAKREVVYQLPQGSRVMETGGYKGRSREFPKDQLHGMISRTLGVPRSHIACEYGMCELSSQAYDGVIGVKKGTGACYAFPPWARATVVSPENGSEVADGETGILQVTDLANVWSAVKVDTGDLAVRHAGGFELLGRAKVTEPRGCSLMSR